MLRVHKSLGFIADRVGCLRRVNWDKEVKW